MKYKVLVDSGWVYPPHSWVWVDFNPYSIYACNPVSSDLDRNTFNSAAVEQVCAILLAGCSLDAGSLTVTSGRKEQELISADTG